MHFSIQQGWGTSMGLWWIIGLVIMLIIVFLILKTGPAKRGRKKEREILNERYNRGEIDTNEYEKKKRNIIDKKSMYQN